MELFVDHDVPKHEIFKHICITRSLLKTDEDRGGHLGIYGIGSQWWCGENGPGGSCNVECADLLDEDIADDVACASLILSQQDLRGFGTNLASCKEDYEVSTEECLKGLEKVENDLIKMYQNLSLVAKPETESPGILSTTLKSSEKLDEEKVISNEPERDNSLTYSIIGVVLIILSVIAVVVVKRNLISLYFNRGSNRNRSFEYENNLVL